MNENETRFFLNRGFGWECKACSREIDRNPPDVRSRLIIEGEAESKTPVLSTFALAKWLNEQKSILICPNCQQTEAFDQR